MKPTLSLGTPASACILALVLAPASVAQLRVPDDYPTIQAAVDASRSGGWIRIRSGQYAEQVVIADKNLTLRGELGATVVAPAAMAQTLQPFTGRRPILAIRNGRVHVHGLSFDGQRSALANPELTGVYFLAASGDVLGCSFTGIRRPDPSSGPSQGIGIQASNPEEAGAALQHLLIANNNVCDTEIAILVKGDLETLPAFDPNAARLLATIQKNEVVGIPGWTGAQQFGVLSQWGTLVSIVDNDVSGFVGVGPLGTSVGILIGVPGVPGLVHPPSLVAFNQLSDNVGGIIALFSQGGTIVFNRIASGAAGSSAVGVSGNNNLVGGNHADMRAAASPPAGIIMFGLESGGPTFVLGRAIDTVVAFNTVLGSPLPVAIWEQTGSSGTRLIGNRVAP